MPRADDTVETRVTVLEKRVDDIEGLSQHVGDIDRRLSLVQADMKHVLSGAGRLSSAVEKLADAAVDQRVATGAQVALTDSALRDLKTSLDDIKTDRAAKKWPPAAKATVWAASIMGALGALATVLPRVW